MVPEKDIKSWLKAWRAEAELERASEITPDASGRRYMRLYLSCGEDSSLPRTAVLMLFGDLAPPEVGGDISVATDVAVFELSNFFESRSVSVPEVYLDLREEGALLIEDVGEHLLGDLIAKDSGEPSEYSSKKVSSFFEAALEELKKINLSKPEADLFAFKRAFTAATFLKEMQEFSDYFLDEKNLSASDWEVVESLYSRLANDLVRTPQVLCHRDYHAWNVMIDHEERLRVIDFQDALMGPRAYDIASLLNDRGMSEVLGASEVNRLLAYYRDLMGWDKGFEREYLRCLLQRDLKVVGRFKKFEKEKGLTKYLQWVDGTYERIRASLAHLTSMDEEGLGPYRDFESLLGRLS